jgi:hypothetical protein
MGGKLPDSVGTNSMHILYEEDAHSASFSQSLTLEFFKV